MRKIPVGSGRTPRKGGGVSLNRIFPGGFWVPKRKQTAAAAPEPRAAQVEKELPTIVARVNRKRQELLKSEGVIAAWRAKNLIVKDGLPCLRSNSIAGAEALREQAADLNKSHLKLLGEWHSLLLEYSELKQMLSKPAAKATNGANHAK